MNPEGNGTVRNCTTTIPSAAFVRLHRSGTMLCLPTAPLAQLAEQLTLNRSSDSEMPVNPAFFPVVFNVIAYEHTFKYPPVQAFWGQMGTRFRQGLSNQVCATGQLVEA